MPALDRYDPENLDDNEDYEELSVDGRRDAEREMRRRDREEGLLHRDDRDLLYGIIQFMTEQFGFLLFIYFGFSY